METPHLAGLSLSAASTSSPLLSLPREVRLPILKELLQIKPETVGHEYSYCINKDYWAELGESSFFSFEIPEEDSVHPQVLRVCRRLYEEGTPLFYDNVVIISIPSGVAYAAETAGLYEKRVELLRRPRRVNIRKVFFIVHAGDDSMYWDEVIHRDAPLIEKTCEALLNAPRYEKVWVQLVDWTIPEAFGKSRDLALMLLRGLGRLHCEKACINMVLVRTAEDLEWAMQRPGPTVPLWLLHHELIAYLTKYDPGDAFNGRNWTLKEFFIRESERATNELNADYFFVNWHVAINHVLGMLEQGLSGAITALDKDEDQIVRRAREEANRMTRAPGDVLTKSRRSIRALCGRDAGSESDDSCEELE